MSKRIIDGPTPCEMSPELDAEVAARTEQADRDVEEMRVNTRWGKAQVALIKRTAALYGMPYQTHVKQAALRWALTPSRQALQVFRERFVVIRRLVDYLTVDDILLGG